MKITLRGEELELLAERAFLWRRKNILGLSDVHIGKAETLQAAGIPIPSKMNTLDFDRISVLIQLHKIREVIILGDRIHHRSSWTPQLLEQMIGFFRAHENVTWKLLLGNHERGSRPYLERLGIELYEESLFIEPFLFTHGHESQDETQFVIQGHIHPVIRLREGPLNLRLPCFVAEERSLLLPAFGRLTGGHEITPEPAARIFAVAGRDIFEVRRDL